MRYAATMRPPTGIIVRAGRRPSDAHPTLGGRSADWRPRARRCTIAGMSTPTDRAPVEAPLETGTWLLEGPAGSGKTRTLVRRAARLLAGGIPGHEILVLLPDRGAARRFVEALEAESPGAFALPRCTTYYGLANNTLEALWGRLAEPAGFAPGAGRPRFIDYEIAQQRMAAFALPRLERGEFEGLAMRPQHLISQLLDGLNKAATGGFDLAAVEPRLRGAWTGEPARLRHYQSARDCMLEFRQHCLERGLVDLSLAVQSFHRLVALDEALRGEHLGRWRQVLVDDLEESVPVAQRLIGWWMESADSTWLALDPEAGHRIFLGADPAGARRLARGCRSRSRLTRPDDPPDAAGALARLALRRLGGGRPEGGPEPAGPGLAAIDPGVAEELDLGDPRAAAVEADVDLELAGRALHLAIECQDRSDMIEAAAEQVAAEVAGGRPAEDIALIAPYVDGVLQFGLREALARRGVALESHRRHIPLRERAIVRAALGALALAGRLPPAEPYAMAETLATLLPELDPVRAALLARELGAREAGRLAPSDALGARERERLGSGAIEAYERLRGWLAEREARPDDLPAFLRALFESLTEWRLPEREEAAAFAQLLRSAERLDEAAPELGLAAGEVAPTFARMVAGGIVAAPEPRPVDTGAAALLAPAHAYLVEDRRHALQIWLDAAAPGWWSPPHQPLTNPWILSPRWPEGARWSSALDRRLRDEVLARLVAGLARRGGGVVVLAAVSGRGGLPLEGPLWRLTRGLAEDGGRLELRGGEEAVA